MPVRFNACCTLQESDDDGNDDNGDINSDNDNIRIDDDDNDGKKFNNVICLKEINYLYYF